MLLNCGVVKTLESPLDCKEIQSVHPKGNQSWIFIGRTDAEAETPILWPPDEKNWLIGKDPDAGKDSGQEEKGTTEDEMVGRHHQLNGHEFEPALGDSEGPRSLACCSSWGCKESDTTERLKKNNKTILLRLLWTRIKLWKIFSLETGAKLSSFRWPWSENEAMSWNTFGDLCMQT